jgi:collagen type VII alpha
VEGVVGATGASASGAEGAAEGRGLPGSIGAASAGGFRRDAGLEVLARAAGRDGVASEKDLEASVSGAEGATEARGLAGVDGAINAGGFRREVGLLAVAGATGRDGVAGEKVFAGLAGAAGATGGWAARLGGTGLEEETRGGTAVKNLGRANGERLTGG